MLTGDKFSEFMKIDLVNPYLEDGRIHNNCSKYLFYNDPLIGTFDSVVKEDTAERFAQAEMYMEQAASHGCLAYMFNNMQLLCRVLKHKADLGITRFDDLDHVLCHDAVKFALMLLTENFRIGEPGQYVAQYPDWEFKQHFFAL